jgi:hypothetical protein
MEGIWYVKNDTINKFLSKMNLTIVRSIIESKRNRIHVEEKGIKMDMATFTRNFELTHSY